MNKMFVTEKSEIIERLLSFCNKNVLNYSSKRNFDFGPPHKNVSKLSPYINRRIITEQQILIEISNIKPKIKTEEFINQIFWRTYFRGWLEAHPWVYENYIKEKNEYDFPKKTGIKCFDNWTSELIETGYLHNHARMWYASIWIFTLRKSWESGANFFKNNLLDWCPASNTLGWRWVAGLHTINKHYTAKEKNINFFTNFRFNPKNQLNENTLPIENDFLNGEALYLSYLENPLSNNLNDIGVVLNDNDLSLNLKLDYLKLSYEGCIFINFKKNINNNNLIKKFEEAIFNDLVEKNNKFNVVNSFDDLLVWAKRKKIKNLIIPFETVGNTIFNNNTLLNKLYNERINVLFYLRKWDQNAFPYAKKGFFQFKKNIPQLLKLNNFI